MVIASAAATHRLRHRTVSLNEDVSLAICGVKKAYETVVIRIQHKNGKEEG